MRRIAQILLLALTPTLALGQAPAPVSAQASSAKLPPISWTCPMHPSVVEDRKGSCPICQMELVAVRLESIWTCPLHTVITERQAGRCPIDRRELIPVTVALSWTCAQQPDINQIEPGKCADGTPMIERHSAWAHGNHNPQHGGLFFMASDNWHHLEGAYPSAGAFRLYLYDDFSRPLPAAKARQVAARAVMEKFDPTSRKTREILSVPLTLSPDQRYLQGRLGAFTLPLQVTAKVVFSRGEPEARFDFSFQSFTKEPAAGATEGAPAPSLPGSSGVAAPSSTPTPALLAELRENVKRLRSEIEAGRYATVYVPALRAKDLALELQSRQLARTAADRRAVDDSVKQIVKTAWLLDVYSDHGDMKKIVEAMTGFESEVAALLSALPR